MKPKALSLDDLKNAQSEIQQMISTMEGAGAKKWATGTDWPPDGLYGGDKVLNHNNAALYVKIVCGRFWLSSSTVNESVNQSDNDEIIIFCALLCNQPIIII